MAELEDLGEQLRRAHETIARQASALRALELAQPDIRLVGSLRQLLRAAAAASRLGEPAEQDSLLEMLVQTAATATAAAAGSLLVIDDAGANLVFKAATGPKASEVRRFVVPLGQGIAGFVAETGEPIAISNVHDDPRFFRDIGETLQYTPTSLLCVPIRKGDAILGVIELLDKAGGGAFTAEDMELVGSLVQQAAVAIGQSKDLRDLAALFLASIRRLAGEDAVDPALEGQVTTFIRREEEQPVHGQAIALAKTIAEIAGEGESELALARNWLDSFLRYLRERALLLY